jgi:hypothetical protein
VAEERVCKAVENLAELMVVWMDQKMAVVKDSV